VSNLMSTYSDDESCDGAPSRDNNTMISMAVDDVSSDEDINEQDKDNFLDGIIFGENNFPTSPIGNRGTGGVCFKDNLIRDLLTGLHSDTSYYKIIESPTSYPRRGCAVHT
jgi:hypothetical protein